MRPLLVFVALLASSQYALPAVFLSAPTNGLYIAVGGAPPQHSLAATNKPVGPNDALVFMVFCDTGQVNLAYPLDPAYGIAVDLTGPDGKSVPKTGLGTRFGSREGELRRISDARLYPLVAWGPYRANPELAGGRYVSDRLGGGSVRRVTTADLFEMSAPGTYNLKLEIRMFWENPASTNLWKRDLIVFPPVMVQVEKRVGK